MIKKYASFPESELLPTIKAHQKDIAPHTFESLDEVESGHGRADIVFFNLNKQKANLRTKQNIKRLKSYQILETISMINQSGKTEFNVTQLYEKLTYSKEYFECKVLDFMVKNNIGSLTNNGTFILNKRYQMAIRETVAIEAKVNNWRRGLFQAYRYRQYADYSFLALHHHYVKAPLSNINLFEKMNVGLISVDPEENEINILFKPTTINSEESNLFKLYTNESVLQKLGFISA